MTVRSGKNGDGPAIEGNIREFLRATYLRPLRDAEGELAAGKGSRLSQILQSHPGFQDQGMDDFDQANPEILPKTLVGIMRHAEHRIANNYVISAARKQLNEEYLDRFSIGDDTLTGSIGVARSTELGQILEKLELRLDPPANLDLPTPRGLGFNNVLFMATELLLLGEATTGVVPLLLIEEPEAHLHPQMQLRLMDFLDDKCTRRDSSVQVLLTTHSPNLASKVDLESVTLMHKGKAFSLASDCTKLDRSDYRFLRRFLDVTKANLFFAKGVIIVEGDAENILLPLLAELLERSFSKNGVSVVNVGSRGLLTRRPPGQNAWEAATTDSLVGFLRSWTTKQTRTHFDRLRRENLLTAEREHANGPWRYVLPEELATANSAFLALPSPDELAGDAI